MELVFSVFICAELIMHVELHIARVSTYEEGLVSPVNNANEAYDLVGVDNDCLAVSENHLLLSDSGLEHSLLRYPQN